MSTQIIKLNFLEITPQEFSLTIFRKVYSKEELTDEVFKYRLPVELGDEVYLDYCITFKAKDGYEQFICESSTNHDMTLKYLYQKLVERVKEAGVDYSVGKKFYDRCVDFTIKKHAKGDEKISLNSYYFKQEKKFGFLIDFFFKANERKNDRELLRLSLALGNDGRSNKNYYSDHFHKIQYFILNILGKFNALEGNETSLNVSSQLTQVNSKFLEKKVYRFKNQEIDTNQFNGVRKYGPFEEIIGNIKYVFIFEDKFKSFANNLFLSLLGKTNPGTFSGMKQFFNLRFDKESVHRVPLVSYNRADVMAAIQEVIKYRDEHNDYKVIAIFLEPDRFENYPIIESPYYLIKHYLTKVNIPVQVVRDDNINNANALKWSTSNIGLQIFSKLGGTPWLLKPSQHDCLILGIGSAYERGEDGSIKKYFAYSVCLDSSGRYKELNILAEESTKEVYLNTLLTNLVKLFSTDDFSKYQKCALHISETVTKDAVQSMQKGLATIANVEFKVLKINTHHKYFGYSNHNTLVPYESTYIKLARSEYLVWFDGLVTGKEHVYRKIGNPIHVKFLSSENITTENDLEYLQDAINLSGASWRGFNAKQTPISISYAKLVADYTAAFSHFEDFDKSELSNRLPWFL